MIENYKNILTHKYADFSGRATRSEYWLFTLVNLIIITLFGVFIVPFGGIMSDVNEQVATLGIMGILGIFSLYVLAVFIPSIAVAVRRLHDTGQSGWLLLLALIPCQIGSLILLIFYCIDSEISPNKYGPNPKNQRPTNLPVGN